MAKVEFEPHLAYTQNYILILKVRSLMNESKTRLIGRLHILTDFLFQQRFGHAKLTQLAIQGGADTIQFRQKSTWIRHKLFEAKATAGICKAAHIPLIIDDHIDIMLAVGASGVHLGQSDFPVRQARRILGPDVIIGATVTTTEQAKRAYDDGADYLGFGPVFVTRSKANPASVKGVSGLAKVCQAVPLPIIAIAGITVDRVRPVLEAGAYGVAVMTAVSCAPHPSKATAAFRKAIDDVLNEH